MAPGRFPRRLAVLLLALLTVVAPGGPAETPPRGQHREAAPFRHPGVLVSGPRLRAIRSRVRDGDRPFRAFRAMRRSRYGRLSCIAAFPDDRPACDAALRRFRARVPAYFYVRADGPRPTPPPGGQIDTAEEITTHWFGQRTCPEGLAREACRNLMHVGHALAATAHIAETACHQGTDLYAEVQPRITDALELHARYQLGERPPASLRGGRVERTMGPELEVAYHRYHDRLGADLPQTAKLLARQRPAGTDDLFVSGRP
ncbi:MULTISPECIES: alginate lyase family protein [unclassified Streptomyces]|uniref:alginate lyase family protein n=1 Tax=unclassified Streptomyces TaxID=2593676 RepID=UPI000AE39B61|nr:alginate lyase family protein [Streptomyces sp. CNQ-509]